MNKTVFDRIVHDGSVLALVTVILTTSFKKCCFFHVANSTYHSSYSKQKELTTILLDWQQANLGRWTGRQQVSCLRSDSVRRELWSKLIISWINDQAGTRLIWILFFFLTNPCDWFESLIVLYIARILSWSCQERTAEHTVDHKWQVFLVAFRRLHVASGIWRRWRGSCCRRGSWTRAQHVNEMCCGHYTPGQNPVRPKHPFFFETIRPRYLKPTSGMSLELF